jgi:hypothetical protein
MRGKRRGIDAEGQGNVQYKRRWKMPGVWSQEMQKDMLALSWIKF